MFLHLSSPSIVIEKCILPAFLAKNSSFNEISRINNLRLGESILLGCETLNREAIPNLHTHSFQLVVEVIESKKKLSLPSGKICQDAFGNTPTIQDRGIHQQVMVGDKVAFDMNYCGLLAAMTSFY